jgi:indole-3-acetate monooxygenase
LADANVLARNSHATHLGADEAHEQQPTNGEGQRLLAALRDLALELTSRAEEIENGRRIPADITARLGSLGLFRTLVPRKHGGMELSIPEVLPLIETLAAADSSVGWITMVSTGGQILCSKLSPTTSDQIYADPSNNQIAGSLIPGGRAEVVSGGYRVSGRWPFVSGCQNAQWLVGHCIVTRNGQPIMAGGRPITRLVILPAQQWSIEDTWRASGLTGSGSHHTVLNDVVVPEANTFELPGPSERPILPLLSNLHSALAIGIAKGAMTDLATMANSGRRQVFATADLRESPVFQQEFGRLGAELRAAHALLQVQAENQWRRSVAGTLDSKADYIEALQATAWIHAACTEVVSGCYTLGGASSIMSASPLQRRLRDVHAARQHVVAQERFYASAGRYALGFPPVDPTTEQ